MVWHRKHWREMLAYICFVLMVSYCTFILIRTSCLGIDDGLVREDGRVIVNEYSRVDFCYLDTGIFEPGCFPKHLVCGDMRFFHLFLAETISTRYPCRVNARNLVLLNRQSPRACL